MTATLHRLKFIPTPDPIYSEPLTPEAKAAVETINSVNQQLQRAGSGSFITSAAKAQVRRLCIEGRKALFNLERSL